MKKKVAVAFLLALEAAFLVNLGSSGSKSKCQEFQCKNGKCLPWTSYCDKRIDCSDKSDESSMCDCTKDKSKKFHCNNKQCIPTKYQCDGQKQCRDGSDELKCQGSTNNTSGSDAPTTSINNPTTTNRVSSLSPSHSRLSHQYKLMWITVGIVVGVTGLLTCLTLLVVYIAVATVSVKRFKEGQDKPVMLHYDKVPSEGQENEDSEIDGNIYETTELLEQPPTYQEVEKSDRGIYSQIKGPR